MINVIELVIAIICFLCYAVGVAMGAFIYHHGLKAGYSISESKETGVSAFGEKDEPIDQAYTEDLPISQESTEVL